MKYILYIAVLFLLCGYAAAQNISPKKNAPLTAEAFIKENKGLVNLAADFETLISREAEKYFNAKEEDSVEGNCSASVGNNMFDNYFGISPAQACAKCIGEAKQCSYKCELQAFRCSSYFNPEALPEKTEFFPTDYYVNISSAVKAVSADEIIINLTFIETAWQNAQDVLIKAGKKKLESAPEQVFQLGKFYNIYKARLAAYLACLSETKNNKGQCTLPDCASSREEQNGICPAPKQ